MPSVGANGIELYFERFGEETDPTALLVAGLGAHSITWGDPFCEALAARGLQVIRFDNRDIGFSTHLPGDSAYSLLDMAADTVGLLDALDLPRVHLVGRSMGGMVAQQVAIDAPERLWTLTSIMSTTGEAEYGQPDQDLLAAMLDRAQPDEGRQAAIEGGVRLARLLAAPQAFDEDYARAVQVASFERNPDPAAVGRHAMAVIAGGSRADGLRGLRVPTLVIHGDEDRLVHPSGGRRTAELVPGARYEEIAGMGHELQPSRWPVVAAMIGDFVAATARA